MVVASNELRVNDLIGVLFSLLVKSCHFVDVSHQFHSKLITIVGYVLICPFADLL